MNDQEKLKADIKDLLNQLAIKLQHVDTPELDTEDEDYGGYMNLPRFKYEGDVFSIDKLGSIKVVVNALLEDINRDNKWSSDAEKLARAYYTSFCNA